MIDKFEQYIAKNNLFNKGTPLLIACSGGVDSMVLLDILQKLEYNILVAHCNFKLRGAESDADTAFVKKYCEENNIKYFIKEFDTTKYKKEHKISTQVAARNLRYEWFEQIRIENKIHFIVTAHHADDQLETILLNFAKGTGLNGLIGIKAKNNFIVRPMLQISKAEILNYATENKIEFREDSSNESIDYTRNKIRHQILPILNEINSSIVYNIDDFSQRMKDISLLLETQIKQIKKKCWTEKDGVVYVKINYIKNHSSRDTVLYYLLKDFGFTNDVLNNVVNHKNISAQFFSDTHRMIIARNELIISSISEVKNNILCFDKIPNQIIFNNFTIQCSLVPIEKLNLKENKNYAYLDVDCIDFPIVVRNLKDGDYFYPFGIGKAKNKSKVGKKKISKYFRDLKLNLLEKENTPIVFSNERALWLVGYAIDDRFKVTANTKQVLKMKIIC